MWAIWIIIIIVVLVFIGVSMIRGSEDEQPREAFRREPRSRAQTSEVDRFLEEINRRRREVGQRQRASEAPPEPARRSRRTARAEPVRTATIPPVAAKTTSVRPELARGLPTVLEVVEEDSAVRKLTRTRAEPEKVPTAAEARPPAVAAVVASARQTGTALAQLLPLLRSAETLRTAVLLHEILGPPRCRRQH